MRLTWSAKIVWKQKIGLAIVKKYYLPAGIVVAVCLALTISDLGAALHRSGINRWLIVLIFLLNGWQVKWRDSRIDHRWLGVFAFGALVSLILGPLAGRGIGGLLFTDPSMVLGITLMAAAPTMIASAIVTTQTSGGNTVWALLFTLGFNLLGIFTAPFMLRFCVDGMDGITIAPWSLLSKLMLLMLLPFLIGVGARRVFRKIVMPKWFGYLPSTAVILMVYATLSTSADRLTNMSLSLIAWIAAGAMAVHLTLIVLLAWSGVRVFKLRPPENRAFFFTGSQKSMVVGVSILAAMGSGHGDAAVVILVGYFCQLLFDSFLATRLHAKSS